MDERRQKLGRMLLFRFVYTVYMLLLSIVVHCAE